MKKITVIVILSVFLIACGNRKWSAADRKKVISDCITSAKGSFSEDKAKSYCECMQPIMEAKFPTVAEANKIKPADMQTPEMQKEAMKCMQ